MLRPVREHPNVAVVRHAYEAVGRRDRETVGNLVSPNVLAEVFAALEGDDTGGPFQARTVVPLSLAAAGNLVVAIDHLCARRGGRPLDVEGVVIFSVADRRIHDVRRVSVASPERRQHVTSERFDER